MGKLDLAGNPTDIFYPDGSHITESWDAAGRLQTVGNGTMTPAYVQSVLYHPDGTPNVTTLGNGVQQTIGKNSRLQVQNMTAADPFSGQTFLSHTYCYVNCSTGGAANNGNIWGITDVLNPARTQGFTYDALNRISSFSLGGVVNQQYQIDSFGNLSGVVNGQPQTTFDSANRVSNLPCASVLPAYDAAGNQLCDTDPNGPFRQYVYDAENRITYISQAGLPAFVAYVYGADGSRTLKYNADNTYTESIYFAGQPLAEVDQNGEWTDYVYAGSQKIARLPATEKVLTISGFNNGTYDFNYYPLVNNGGLGNYAIGQGDKLVVRQRSHGSASAGVVFVSKDASGNYASMGADADGQQPADDHLSNEVGHRRVFDLSPQAGASLQQMYVAAPQNSGSGAWAVDYADMMLFSAATSTWIPIQTEGHTVALTYWSGSFNGGSTSNATWTVAPVPAVTGQSEQYFLADHLGTAQMQFGSGGWPA